MKNFKSFKKADIPFARGFTAIAGANASGKSNILDALLFAMGITSLKQLRASRLTELVNHDSKEGYAKVELIIENDDHKEINVTRIIDKQGKSIYKLDDKRKSLNEIQSFLLEIGINPNGHNIVVQGDITKVIEMNSKQRRQVIEEVAGLQEFEEKKNEALKKLDKVEQKVKDANLVLNERESYLSQLEKERENALKHNQLHEELKRSKVTILNEEIKIIRKELGSAKKNLETMNKEIIEKRKERDKLQEEERELEVKVEEATKKLINASEQTYSGLGKEVEQMKGQINLVNERINSKNEIIDSKSSKLQEVQEQTKELKKSKNEKREELKVAKESLEKVNSQLNQLKVIIDSKNPKLEKKKEGIGSKEDRLSELVKTLDELKDDYHEIKIKKNNSEKDATRATEIITELESTKRKLEEKLLQKREIEKKIQILDVKSPKERLITKEQELEKIMSELHNAKGRVESIQESMEKLSKAESDCPTCDYPLEENRKEKVTQKKAIELQKLKSETKNLSEQKELLLLGTRRIRGEEKELSELIHSVKAFHGLEEELRIIKERVVNQKEILSSKKRRQLKKPGTRSRSKYWDNTKRKRRIGKNN